MPIPDPADRLRLVQWLSPAFPVGAYAYSQGLEAAIAQGDVSNAATLREWVSDVLTLGTGRLDSILLAHARRPDCDLQHLADLALAFASSSGRATELREQGRAFALIVGELIGKPFPQLPYPVAVGFATRHLRVTTNDVLQLWLMALAAQLVSAAVRFVPLGQTDGQRVLSDLARQIVHLAQDYAAMSLDDLSSTTPRADLAAMHHETMDVRIFRT